MIFLPSRERPWGVKRFINAYWHTRATHPVVVSVDEENTEMVEEYKALELPPNFSLQVSPRAPYSHDMNALFRQYPNESVYGFLADDVVPFTLRWDKRLIEAAKEYGVVWPNDVITTPGHNKRSGHYFIDGDLLREVGIFCPPAIHHFYSDNVWIDIADRVGMGMYMEDVIVEHLHFSNGRALHDATYQSHAPHARADQNAYEAWSVDPETEAMIQRIREGNRWRALQTF